MRAVHHVEVRLLPAAPVRGVVRAARLGRLDDLEQRIDRGGQVDRRLRIRGEADDAALRRVADARLIQPERERAAEHVCAVELLALRRGLEQSSPPPAGSWRRSPGWPSGPSSPTAGSCWRGHRRCRCRLGRFAHRLGAARPARSAMSPTATSKAAAGKNPDEHSHLRNLQENGSRRIPACAAGTPWPSAAFRREGKLINIESASSGRQCDAMDVVELRLRSALPARERHDLERARSDRARPQIAPPEAARFGSTSRSPDTDRARLAQ